MKNPKFETPGTPSPSAEGEGRERVFGERSTGVISTTNPPPTPSLCGGRGCLFFYFGFRILCFIFACIAFVLSISTTSYASSNLTYQYHEQIFNIQPQKGWKEIIQIPVFRGRELVFSEGDEIPSEVTMEERIVWNRIAIASSLEKIIGDNLNREAGRVRIFRDEKGEIAFDGVGLTGRKLDVLLAADMTVKALEEDISLVQLPVTETPPEVVVEDEDLHARGIKELVAIGESNYAGSPANREHNIMIGLAQFNGRIIGKGEEFSFGKTLGAVNATTGYRPELTIMGERTIPEYGGGLCQVSTTAFRGAWIAGLPITARRNHSYAVRYYSPPGTDATIFPPFTDLKFLNDTNDALLLQTYHEDDHAYFIYYGTKPIDRTVELVGPFTWDPVNPPEDRYEYTSELPPGETRVLGRPVPGMKTMWYRIIATAGEEKTPEPFFSQYEARPYYEEIGLDFPPPTIVSTPQIEKEVIKISEETKITIPRRGERIRIRDE